jgi:hypothetical protein
MPKNIEGSKRPQRLTSYVVLISDPKLSLFIEANKLQVWKDAMLDEYKAHHEEQYVGRFPGLRTSKLSHPNGWPAGCSWRKCLKYKVRFAARSFSQE